MNVVVFGAGATPAEPQFAVTAPGARTWQMARTIALGMQPAAGLLSPPHIIIVGLEAARRETGDPTISLKLLGDAGRVVDATYIPLSIDDYREAGTTGKAGTFTLPDDIHAVVGTGSVQPYSTAAAFATLRNAPLWLDVFGDPLAEIQTQAEVHADDEEAAGQQQVHGWKLFLDGLLRADAFSALSTRQRFAIIGQLGAAGRLNQFTARDNFVHSIPYGLFPDEVPNLPSGARRGAGATFTIMWSGSFNTWMDVDVLLSGFLKASSQNPRLRLTVVGGRIPGYNDASYDKFVSGVRAANAESIVQLMDWQPLGRMRELYGNCNVGLSIDRFSYEAVLGSRTRIVNFLAAGKPVLSTVLTELTEDLADKGYIIPFQLGSADDFAKVLEDTALRASDLATLGEECQAYVLARYDGRNLGKPLIDWIKNPAASPDRSPNTPENNLVQYWRRVREPLGK
jgi:glycosyltransferase involved in cell wall biosynthesis